MVTVGLWFESFNPRPRTGGDHRAIVERCGQCELFQSAPPHGGRQTSPSRLRSWGWFQSAPPHGGRPLPAGGRVGRAGFNPRPRTGGDVVHHVVVRFHAVSIRAPARGATEGNTGVGVEPWFQSAPPHGGRHDHYEITADIYATFQSAPPHGGRPGCSTRSCRALAFQSAPPHGGRHPRPRYLDR